MRKIILFNLITLDGFFAGEDGNIDWHMVDDEFNDFAVEQTGTFGGIIFGKTTYELFEPFWSQVAQTGRFPGSDQDASPDDVKVGKFIHEVEKFVFSKSLNEVTWQNTTLYHEIDPEEIKKLKAKEGKPVRNASQSDAGGDIFILGSGTIAQQFANLDMIDEYRLLVNPVILGKGKPMFKDVDMKKLNLLATRKFGNGNVLMTYSSEQK
jgi:dihydrofolate reductase